jgi:hypothetical protein
MEENLDLYQYCMAMSKVKFTLWNDLPENAIYADKLLQIVKDELPFMKAGNEKLITKSMVNNYVKWGMLPKPIKKKYGRLHIASVIVITVLKQILPIAEIKEGIQLQAVLHGTQRAYDAFCLVLEEAMSKVFSPVLGAQDLYVFDERKIENDKLAISAITTALCSKLLTEKIIETKINLYSNKDNENVKGKAHE